MLLQTTEAGLKTDLTKEASPKDQPAASQDQSQKKLKKPLKLSNKANAYRPEDAEVNEPPKDSQTKPPEQPPKQAQPYALLEDLKPAANPMARNTVSNTSASFMPFMPFQPSMMQYAMPMHGMPMAGMPMQMATMAMPGMPMQMQMPMQMPFTMPTVPQQPMVQPTAGNDDDYSMMYQHLINNGMLNINPKVYNQLTPGQELSMNLQMQPGLQQYTEDLTEMNQEELVDYYQDLLMQEYVTRPEHSFGDHSNHNTYSDLNEDDFEDEFDDGEEGGQGENPGEWATDPETEKRREEIRKNFFNPDFKDCECCKGYISNCGNEICKNLGVCHCVVRKQNEDNQEVPDSNEMIAECASCTCCQGFVHKCDCVSRDRKTSCKCIS